MKPDEIKAACDDFLNATRRIVDLVNRHGIAVMAGFDQADLAQVMAEFVAMFRAEAPPHMAAKADAIASISGLIPPDSMGPKN